MRQHRPRLIGEVRKGAERLLRKWLCTVSCQHQDRVHIWHRDDHQVRSAGEWRSPQVTACDVAFLDEDAFACSRGVLNQPRLRGQLKPILEGAYSRSSADTPQLAIWHKEGAGVRPAAINGVVDNDGRDLFQRVQVVGLGQQPLDRAAGLRRRHLRQ